MQILAFTDYSTFSPVLGAILLDKRARHAGICALMPNPGMTSDGSNLELVVSQTLNTRLPVFLLTGSVYFLTLLSPQSATVIFIPSSDTCTRISDTLRD